MDWEAFYGRFREKDFVPGYEIQNRLGGGAFGEVYKARKHSIGKAFAIKFLKIEDDEQRKAVERELEQVRHFAAIDHPNLVTIEDLGSVMDVPYLIMGYAGEETLARALRQRKIEPDSALLYFVQACRGVLALHDRRLVHFDLKPSNIFIKGEIARVGDYGLSKMMSDGRSTLSFGRGTPHYMAPEMLRNRADHRADLYSLGVILYESISGRLPYESAVPGTLAVREDDLPPHFPAGFPPLLRVVVERALRIDPDARYASVGELLEDLGATARPGDSVRIDWQRLPPARTPRPPREAPATPPAAAAPHSEARQTAAELTRGAVEVARGVWDGLRNARSPATPQALPSTGAPEPAPTSLSSYASDDYPLGSNVLIQTLSDGAAALVPRRTELARSTFAGTIPVPPEAEGGVRGTLSAALQLAVEVLLTIVSGVAGVLRRFVFVRGAGRGADAVQAHSPSWPRRIVRVLGRIARVILFVVLMLVLGGLATVVAVLLWTRGSA